MQGSVRAINILTLPLYICLVLLLCGCQGVEQGEELVEQGNTAMSQGRFQDAERAFQNYLQHHPEGKYRWQAWQRLVTIHQDIRRDMDMANSLLATMSLEFKADSVRTAHILMQQAEVNMARGDTETALTCLEQGRALHNLSKELQWDMLMAQAKTAIRAHRFALAHTVLSKGLEQAPDEQRHALAVYLNGLALVYLGEYEHARQLLEKEFAAMPPSPLQARLGLSLTDIAEHEARYTDALDLLRQIKPFYPNPRVLEIRERTLQKKIATGH